MTNGSHLKNEIYTISPRARSPTPTQAGAHTQHALQRKFSNSFLTTNQGESSQSHGGFVSTAIFTASNDSANEEPAPECLHKAKPIHFFGRPTPIVLQNDNGPCPLLAICNVLSLKNQLNLIPERSEVSQQLLLSLVAERLLDSNSNVNNKDARYVKNLQQNITDVMDLLPCLTTGIDVNVKFRRINDFEFTRECAIFGLLDIPLYHGWLVDPQDCETAKAIGSKSYSTITQELVLLQVTEGKGKVNTEENSVEFVAATTTLGIPSPCLSRDKSSHDSPRASFDGPTTRKGDAEEEAELLRILELSKMESPCAEVLTAKTREHSYFDDLAQIAIDSLVEDETTSSPVSTHEQCNGKTSGLVGQTHENRETRHPASTKLDSDLQILSTSGTGLNDETHTENEIDNSTPMSPHCDSSSCRTLTSEGSEATESFTSTLGSEPTYEEEKCIWDSAVAAWENFKPLYEGEVIVAKQVEGSSLDVNYSDFKDEITPRDWELINNFLQNSASQLTFYGLFSLQEGLKERELCVFFRNNHFSTTFKFEGGLYILITDQGYLNEPGIVWEKLNEISRASVFCDSNFQEFVPESQANCTWGEQNPLTSTTDYLGSIGNFRQDVSSTSSDLQLAIALQEQENEQQ